MGVETISVGQRGTDRRMIVAALQSTRWVTSTTERSVKDAGSPLTTRRTGPHPGMRPVSVKHPKICSPTVTGR